LNNAYYFFAGATSSSSSSSSSGSGGKGGKGKSKSSKHHTTPSAFHLGAKQGVKPGQIAVVTIKTPKPKHKQSTPTPNIKKDVKAHNKAIAQKHHTPAPDIVGDARKHNQEIQAKHDAAQKAKASNPVHKIIHNTPPPHHHHIHLTKPQRDVQAAAQRKQQQNKTPTIHHTIAPTHPHPSIVHHVSPPPKSIHHVIHTTPPPQPTVHTSSPSVVHPSTVTPSKPASHNVIHNITNPHTSPVNIQQQHHHHIHLNQAQRDLNASNRQQQLVNALPNQLSAKEKAEITNSIKQRGDTTGTEINDQAHQRTQQAEAKRTTTPIIRRSAMNNQVGGVTAGIIGGTINQSPLTNVVHHHIHQQHLDTQGKPVSVQSLLPLGAPGSLPISSSKINTPRISGTDGSPKQIIKGTPNPFTNPNPNLAIGDPIKSITGVFQGIGNQLGLNQQQQSSSVPIHHHPLQHHITVSQTFNNPQKLAEFNAQSPSVRAAEISRHNTRFKQFQSNIQKQNANSHPDANDIAARNLLKAQNNPSGGDMMMNTPKSSLTPAQQAIINQDAAEEEKRDEVTLLPRSSPMEGFNNTKINTPLGADILNIIRNPDGSSSIIKSPQNQQDLHDILTSSNFAHSSSSNNSYLPIIIGGGIAVSLLLLPIIFR
jgi:hypothetical protein